MARIAINGFGRIGRLFFRQVYNESGRTGGALDIVAVNDVGDIDNLAYLLEHDTVYWRYGKSVAVVREDGKSYLAIDGKKVLVTQEKDPAKLPWKDLQIDIAVEATGLFDSFHAARAHIGAGAKRAVITAPATDEEQGDAKTVLLGVNEEQFKACVITSNGSCTTNAAHPVMAVMLETVGVLKAALTAVHGYTATQNLVDGAVRGRDFKRGRAAAANIIPSSSGVTNSVARALPALLGKFDGLAMRVPVIAGSLVDCVFVAARQTSKEEINDILKKAAAEPRWQGILAVSDESLVSSDIIGMPYGAIIDLPSTKVVGGDLVKVFSWYDNEWGYASMLMRHVEKVAEIL